MIKKVIMMFYLVL